jgi:arginase family enzyme
MEIYGIGFSNGSLGKNLGCERAPEELSKLIKGNIFKNIDVFEDNLDKTHESIFNSLRNIKKGIIIGGDHSITYSCFKAFAFSRANAGLIIFDAHPDVEGDFKVSHEDYLRCLINENILDASRVVLIGVRKISKEEREYLNAKKILYFDMRKIIEIGAEDICTLVMEKAIEWDNLYLSIDIDVCDPAFAPGTGYIEPGGISSAELLYFISRIKRMKNFGFADIVEINPAKDINKITISLGMNIIGEILNETFYSN